MAVGTRTGGETMSYMDCTASQIADELAATKLEAVTTGFMAILEEATLEFAGKRAPIAVAHAVFSAARRGYQRTYDADDGFSTYAGVALVAAAHWLAEELRKLGDMKIDRCQREAGWGKCNLALSPGVPCEHEHHTD
jgi:hypothetical protein